MLFAVSNGQLSYLFFYIESGRYALFVTLEFVEI